MGERTSRNQTNGSTFTNSQEVTKLLSTAAVSGVNLTSVIANSH
jgi:hypothetical protein